MFRFYPSYALVLLLGALMPLCFAPFNLFFWPVNIVLQILALAVFIYLIERSNSAKQAFYNGWLFGIGFFASGVSWIFVAINTYGAAHWLLAGFLTLLFIVFIALYYALFAWVLLRLSSWYRTQPAFFYLLLIPVIWIGFEVLRSYLFTGFPWLIMGYPLINTPLAEFAPLLGVYGLSFLVMMLTGLLLWSIKTDKRQRLFALSMAFTLFLLGWGMTHIEWTQEEAPPLKVAIVQGSIPQAVRWNNDYLEKTIDLYKSMSLPYWKKSDVIIWPENAIPSFYHTFEHTLYAELSSQAKDTSTTFLTGLPIMDRSTRQYYNSLLSLGAETGVYSKEHLVPFGEYVPFEKVLRGLISFFNLPMSSFSPAEQEQALLAVAGVKTGATICYEDVFPEQVRRWLPEAGLLVNISNNGWYGNSLAPHQHLEMARMRALESGRDLIRSTTSGISALIDYKGSIIKEGPQFEAVVIVGEVRPRSGATPFVYWGHIPLYILAALTLLLAWRLRSQI